MTQQHAGILLSAMAVMTDLQSDLLARLAISIRSQLSEQPPHNNDNDDGNLGPECQPGDVQMAVRFTLPGELAKYAVSEGAKYVARKSLENCNMAGFYEGKSPKEAIRKWLDAQTEPCLISQTSVLTVGCALTHELGGHIVVTPAAAVYVFLTLCFRLQGNQKGDGSSKSRYLAAVLEYITVEVLELAGNAAKDLKRSINDRHATRM